MRHIPVGTQPTHRQIMKYKVSIVKLFACLACMNVAVAGDLDWPVPSTFNRPGAFWWWMGSAVDKENITWNLETMNKAGMGGGTIVPIYGVKGHEEQYIQQ